MIDVLHITAHLGLGVGKALSGLILNSEAAGRDIRHKVVCLEKPEKTLFIDRIVTAGHEVVICPSPDELCELVARADVVQLEWWNHPATIGGLCRQPLPPMRLLVWCHISGLRISVIPQPLIRSAHKFFFTSPCSYQARNVAELVPEYADRMGVVHSCGGFDGFPFPTPRTSQEIIAGYVGSLNFAKLHPDYVGFLKEVADRRFKVRMIGDVLNRELLEQQCRQVDRENLLEFCGYTQDVVSELQRINVLVYLLNPYHYGTTENALLEAMAMGVVPIVLDNPVESCIVEDGKTGVIISSPADMRRAVQWLTDDDNARWQLGRNAAEHVRDRYKVGDTVETFNASYRDVCRESKRQVDFTAVFGDSPSEWFLSCQEYPEIFTDGKAVGDRMMSYGMYEKTKGTVFHFHSHFPADDKLREMAGTLLRKPD